MKTKTIDARGLSCPEPAMLTRRALNEQGNGQVIVLVDAVTSRNNVIRTAQLAGWKAEIEEQPDGTFRLILTK